VTGANLNHAQEVAFLLLGRPDTQLRAAIKQVTPEAVTLDVSISANAEFGGRQVQVTSPSGAGVSPLDVDFTVAPGPIQVTIVALGAIAILLHVLLQLPAEWYVLIAVVYAALLVAMYLPLPGLSHGRPWLRWALIMFALANVIGWIAQASQPQLVRFVVPLIEVALAALLFVESQQPQWRDAVQQAKQ
jgi:hypothetical protein